VTARTLPPHEDDLRTFAAELRRATNLAESAVHCAAHGEEIGPDLTAAVDAAFGALQGLGHAPTTGSAMDWRCANCGATGARLSSFGDVWECHGCGALLMRTPRCLKCADTGRTGDDHICSCPAGDSFRAVAVGKPQSEVTG